MLKIYFLFLIKYNFNNLKLWKNYFKNAYNYQIIIHPKIYKENYLDLNEIVLHPIETKWGDISLADAEVNLLKKALSVNKSKRSYLFLLSDDSIPIRSYNKFYKFLNLNKLSFFNYSDYLFGNKKFNNLNFVFSSQFFCVNIEDALIVVNNYKKYKDKILNFKKIFSPDETFMLSILFGENKDYKFNDTVIIEPISFSYKKNIPEIENLKKSLKELTYKLYVLKDNNNLSVDQSKALDSLIRFKNYCRNHSFTFLYDNKLVDKFKRQFTKSFFIRKITSKYDEKKSFSFEDIYNLKVLIEKKKFKSLSKFLNKTIDNLKN